MAGIRSVACVASVSAVMLLAACSDDSGEPRGLTGSTAPAEATTGAPGQTTPSPKPSTEPAPTATEPNPSFTQPFVPGEPRVVEVLDSVAVEGADNLDPDEQAVVDALGHAMAAWDAMLFGVPPDLSTLEDWFSGSLLASLQNYGRDSVFQHRVTVGSPTRVVLREVSTSGDEATASVCLHTEDWVEYVDGEPGEPVEPVESYLFDAVRTDGEWTFADLESSAAPC